MSNIQNIDKRVVADSAERIEHLINNARENVSRSINITEVVTKYKIGRIVINVYKRVKSKQLLQSITDSLTESFGTGWSVETLKRCEDKFEQNIKRESPACKRSSCNTTLCCY